MSTDRVAGESAPFRAENPRSAREGEHDLAQVVLDAAETLILVLDGDGRVERSNRAVERVSGRPPADFLGHPLWDTLVAPECRELAAAELHRMRPAAYDGRTRGEHQWATAFGERRTIAWTLMPLRLEDRTVRVFTGVDVTGERRAQRRLNDVLDATTSLCLIGTDPNGVITFFNPGAERLLGFAADEVVGCGTLAQFHDEEELAARAEELGVDPGVDALVQAPVHTGEPEARDWTYVCRDGRRLKVSVTVSVMRGPGGEVAGFLAVAEDLTERTRTEQALMTALEHEREAADRLVTLDRMRSGFVASVGHELRTPLTSILGFTHLLAGRGPGRLNTRQRALLERVDRNSRRLLGMIEDLLAVSHMDAGSWEQDESVVELRDVIAAGIEETEELRRGRDLTLRLRLDDGVPTLVRGDADQLRRVLVNLLSNAIKFTQDGGTIEIELSSLPDQLLLTVCDTGVGIPPDELEHLFTRFFRATTATSEAIPGSGLGLNITRSIVEQHGGDIVVTSVLDQGTLVEISLPPAV